jgi:hypothetical protein
MVPSYATGDSTQTTIYFALSTWNPYQSMLMKSTLKLTGVTVHKYFPSDGNLDGRLDISDAVFLLGHLFLGKPTRLPCGDGTTSDVANRRLLDANGDGRVDLSDAVYSLSFLFTGGPPPALGRDKVDMPGCP